MKLSEICHYLESVAPLPHQESYDNSGLLVGDPEMECTGGLLTLDVTPAVMEEASRRGCNLVIAHHPFIFKGIKRLTAGMPETQILEYSFRRDIALYAIHTNLDNQLQGLNALLMKRLGIAAFRVLNPRAGLLEKLVTFCPVAHAEKVSQALFSAGAGLIGNYDSCSFSHPGTGTFRASEGANPFVGEKHVLHSEPEIRLEVILPTHKERQVVAALLNAHPYEEVAYDLYPLNNRMASVGSGLIGQLPLPMPEKDCLELIRTTLHVTHIRHSAFRGKPVERIALCTGSGSFIIQDALNAGADMLITADLKYHDFSIPDNRMMLADIGHYESEQWVKEWLHAVLIEKYPNFAFPISEVNTNPVHYF